MREFIAQRDGHDLVEYSLLLGAIALGGMASLNATGKDIDQLWSILNSRVTGS